MELSNIRKNFGLQRLLEADLPAEPSVLLKTWLEEAGNEQVPDFNAMVLSTVGQNNAPSSRVVLLKEIDERACLIFYTNYESRKGTEISRNNQVSVNFFWPLFERQVRIEGIAEKISRDKSSQYFKTRPVESQVSAVLSPQSREINNLSELRQLANKMLQKNQMPEIPANWGGYAIEAKYYEFWQGGTDRLHDRIVYSLTDCTWKKSRLAP